MLVAVVCFVENVFRGSVRYHYVDGRVVGDGVGGFGSCASGGGGVEAVDVAGIGEGPVFVFGRVWGGVDLGGFVSWLVWIFHECAFKGWEIT